MQSGYSLGATFQNSHSISPPELGDTVILWFFIFWLLGRPAWRPSDTILWLRDLAPGENKNMVSSERWCFRALKPIAIGLRPGRYIPKQPPLRPNPPELGDMMILWILLFWRSPAGSLVAWPGCCEGIRPLGNTKTCFRVEDEV